MTLTISTITAPVPIATAASTLPFPPTVWGMVQFTSLTTNANVCPPEMELVMWTDGTSDNVTVAKLYAGILETFAFGADAMDSVAFPSITDAAHGLFTGDGPVQLTTSGTIPAGLALLTNYWVVVVDTNTIQLATSFANAMAATPVIVSFTGNGTGTLTLNNVAGAVGTGTARVHWCELLDINGNQIGRAHDGAVALTNTAGWKQRFPHDPLTVAYALSATLSAGTCSASVTPLQSR